MNFTSQIGQDQLIVDYLKGKRNGYFIDLGCNMPKTISNTYSLETYFGWSGLAIDINPIDEPGIATWAGDRPASILIRDDAFKIDYESLFLKHGVPYIVDYLSIDIDANNPDTILTLLPFHSYKFRVISFETDLYKAAAPDILAKKCRDLLYGEGYDLLTTLPPHLPKNRSQDDIWVYSKF